MKRFLRWLFGITAIKVIELKKGDCLLVTTPPERRMSQDNLKAVEEAFERHIGKRVLIAEPCFELTVIRPPGD